MNVSMHAPIEVTLSVGLDNKNIRSSTKAKPQAKTVLSWNQIDLEKYSIELRRTLPSHTGSLDVEIDIAALMDCLRSSAKKSVPSKIYSEKQLKDIKILLTF